MTTVCRTCPSPAAHAAIVKMAKSSPSPSDLPASPLVEPDPLSEPNAPRRRRRLQPGEVDHAPEELARGEWDPKSDPGFADDEEPDDDPDDEQHDDVVPGHAVKTGGRLDGKPIFQKPIATAKRLRRAAGTLDGVPIYYKPTLTRPRKKARLL